MTESIRIPSFLHSMITFIAIITTISLGLAVKINLHSIMLINILIVSISSLPLSKNGFTTIKKAMNNSIYKSLTSIYIFILIGVLIAALIQSGTLVFLMFYGLKLVSPSTFLPACLIICSLMSIITGTSWGTIGTIGAILINIGLILKIPTEIVAGTIVSGAVFGDKISPVSDTTNLTSMSTNVKIYDHIKSMLLTSIPTYILVLITYTIIGLQYTTNDLITNNILEIQHSISNNFNISILTVSPIFVMLYLIYKKVSAIVTIFITALSAILFALLLQDVSFVTIMNAIYNGGKPNTNMEQLNPLLTKGGIKSMMWTLSIALFALAIGGILDKFKFLHVIIYTVAKRIKSITHFITITILSCILGNALLGEAYMSIILGGQVFKNIYKYNNIDKRILSRSIEEGATLSSPLIPWTTGGIFFSSVLNVSTFEFAPWALFNIINPIISIIFAYIGIAIFTKKNN